MIIHCPSHHNRDSRFLDARDGEQTNEFLGQLIKLGHMFNQDAVNVHAPQCYIIHCLHNQWPLLCYDLFMLVRFVCPFTDLFTTLCTMLAGIYNWIRCSRGWAKQATLLVITCTPHPCTKGKVINHAVVVVVIIHTRTARSWLLGVSVSVQYGHNVKNGKKVMSLCFKMLDNDHECYIKSCSLIGHD